jgi:hypothetical protein
MFVALVSCLVFMTPNANAGELLNFTNSWRYDDSQTTSGKPEELIRLKPSAGKGTVWRSAVYDDSAWQQGSGFFGHYTDVRHPYPVSIRTRLTPEGGRITHYFRTHFTLPANTVGFALIASNYVADGAVFYLNGTEVGRLRMPDGVVTDQTPAASASSGEEVQPLTFSTGSLVQGDNVVAVEVHQTTPTNPDVVFGMNLSAIIETNLAHKILVDRTDTNRTSQLAASGAVNLANYTAFSLWSVTASQAPPALLNAPSVTIRYDFDAMPLRGGLQINTQTGEPGIPPNLSEARTNGFQFWMVQYAGPIQNAWLSELKNTGVQTVWYIPANGYVVWGNLQSLARLDKLAATRSYITGHHAYHPYYRLEASLQEIASSQPSNQMVNVTVQVFNSPNVNQTLASLRSLGGRVWRQPGRVQQLTSISLQLPAGQLIAVANWSDVYNVEPWISPTLQDEVQGQIVAGNVVTSGVNIVPQPTTNATYTPYRLWLVSKGFPLNPTNYPIVDVVDDGVDNGQAASPGHPDFYYFGITNNASRIAYIGSLTSDPLGDGLQGHGNLNAGIVAAYDTGTLSPDSIDTNGYNIGMGISPLGRVAGTKIFGNTGDYTSQSDAGVVGYSYGHGAGLTSDSWGASTYGVYNAEDQAYDSLTRNASNSSPAALHEMLDVFAAGNDGNNTMTPAPPSTVASPGSAKNVLTVGATENVRVVPPVYGNGNCWPDTASNADNVAYFSERGPTADGRYKPDIMAPGTKIQGLASQDPGYNGGSVCLQYYPPGQTWYAMCSGTSQATPAVAGSASLIYENYHNLLSYQNEGNPTTPSPAMLKALVINSARYMASGNYGTDTLPSDNFGWGDVDLGLAFDGLPRLLVDQTQIFNSSGSSYTYPGTLSVYDTTKPLRVTLVWSDAPGNTTGNAYVNDLNLTVTAGGTYLGNVFSGQYSTPGGSADTKNNVENVFLPAGVTNPITVTVTANNLAAGAIPGNTNPVNQDFALVIYNAIQATTPVADVYIRDDAADNGTEPNPNYVNNTANMWESPDIWNRLDPAPDSTQTYEQPEYGVDNYINVHLWNHGTTRVPTSVTATGVVKLYWAYGSSSLSWPNQWNWFADIPTTVPANSDQIVNILWHPPSTGHICIMAQWVSGQDPLHAQLTSDVNFNTGENNNIAWRNMEIVTAPPNTPIIYSFIMRNPVGSGTSAVVYNLRLRALPTTKSDTFLGKGQIFFDLGPTLHQRWLRAGAQGTGFKLVTDRQTSIIGSSTFSVGDLVNLPSLASRLKQPADAVSLYLKGRLSAATLKTLAKYQGTDHDPSSQTALVKDFNRIIRGQSIYDAQRFAGVVLRPETQLLLTQNPEGDDLLRLNRLLLEDAYPMEISRSRIVFQVLNAAGTYIKGIPINPGEDVMVNLKFISQTKQARVFKVDATQMTVSNTTIGGMTCLVNTGPKHRAH